MSEALEQLQESPPKGCTETAALLSWSVNYDHPTPAALFLDIIGFSDEEFGEPLFDLRQIPERFGYLEISYLADALKEYANSPLTVMEYVRAYLEAEMDE